MLLSTKESGETMKNTDKNTSQDKISDISFVGGGQMAEALIKGIISKGLLPPGAITVSDPSKGRLKHLEDTYQVKTTPVNGTAIESSKTILIAVKPQVIGPVLEDIRSHVTSRHLIISIAAGIPTKTLEGGLPKGTRVIRVMPNTPALVQAGAAAICKGSQATDEDLDIAMGLFNAVGTAQEVPEALMDAVTGLSGSGPAYCFVFMDALADAGVMEGLPRPVALKLAVQTMLGSALLCQETGKHPEVLKDMVTSPGGTTIAGLFRLEEHGLRHAVMDAVRAATRRAKELGDNT